MIHWIWLIGKPWGRSIVLIRYALSSSEDGSKVISLPFYHYRGYRINAMAVTGLLARVYSYWGG